MLGPQICLILALSYPLGNSEQAATMTDVLRKSYKGFSFLLVLNWDAILCFGATALALAGGAYLATL